MGTYNTVFAGVVTGRAAKDTNPNLLFGGLFGSLPNRTFRHVEEKLAEPGRGFKVLACRNPLHHSPSQVAATGGIVFRRFGYG
jgi:hypothetical protein